MKTLMFILFVSWPTHQPDPKDTTFEQLWKAEERAFLVQGLERTKAELLSEISDLTQEQWNFKEEAGRWSIREIVEHLEVQDEMYYREIFLVSTTPQSPKYRDVVKGKDEEFLRYASDPTPGKAGWYLQPIGRYGSKEQAEKAFLRTRGELIAFVTDTKLDLRKFFTFRKYVDDGGLSKASLWDVRDLHQLLLTTIAHTDRHLHQLRKVKKHPNYPNQ